MNTEKFSLIKGIAAKNELTYLETCHKNFVLSHKAELWLTVNDHRNTNRGPTVDSSNLLGIFVNICISQCHAHLSRLLEMEKKFSCSETA